MESKVKTLTSRKERQVSIDLMECIAIFSVVMYHSILYSSDILSEASSLHYLRYLFNTALSACVPLFFFANGYLLFNREFNLKKHIYKTIHIIILCGVWAIFKTLLIMLIENEPISPSEFVNALVSMKWINSLWFLGALVCVYIFFPILKAAYDNNRKAFHYFLIVCAVLVFGNVLLNEGGTIFLTFVLNKPKVLEEVNFFNMFNPFRGMHGYTIVYFCLGGCFYNIKDKILNIKPLKRNIIALLVMAISCLGLFGVGICYSIASNTMWDVVWRGYDTIFALVNTICIFVLCLNLRKDIKFIRTISCNTLGIYLMHEIIISLTYDYIAQFDFLCNIPFNIVYAFIVMMICLVIALVIRKIPYLRLLVS